MGMLVTQAFDCCGLREVLPPQICMNPAWYVLIEGLRGSSGFAALLTPGQPLGRDSNWTRVVQENAVGDLMHKAPTLRDPRAASVLVQGWEGVCRENAGRSKESLRWCPPRPLRTELRMASHSRVPQSQSQARPCSR